LKNITITTLYTYAKGFNIASGNVIPMDEKLAKVLPNTKSLCWHGIDRDRRQYLLKNNERPEKTQKVYNDSMPNAASLQIQQMIRNFPRGELILKRILNDD